MRKPTSNNTKNESNRRNAMKSTGPRSITGKAISSRNAVTHGGYSEALIVAGERPEDFHTLMADFAGTLRPVGPLEERLLLRLVSLWWRIGRATRAEREGLKVAVEDAQHDMGKMRLLTYDPLESVVPIPAPDYSEPTHTGFTWKESGEHIERLARYESQLERSFFRTLHELERIQARRRGQPVTAPAVLDVNLSQSK